MNNKDDRSKRSTQTQPASDLPAGLAKPAQRALAGAGYASLEQLSRTSEAEVLALHGMGPKALETLKRAMDDKGLSFARQ